MSDRAFTTSRPPGTRALRTLLGIAFGVLSASAWSAGASVVPAQYHGTWIPEKASCGSHLRVVVTGDKITLANGADTQAIGGIEMAGPGWFPPGYSGIQAVAITEFDGHQPVMATFNAGEKKGAALIEYSPVQPGKGNPQLNAYNAHIAKLNLAKRFPLDKMPLKKCA